MDRDWLIELIRDWGKSGMGSCEGLADKILTAHGGTDNQIARRILDEFERDYVHAFAPDEGIPYPTYKDYKDWLNNERT